MAQNPIKTASRYSQDLAAARLFFSVVRTSTLQQFYKPPEVDSPIKKVVIRGVRKNASSQPGIFLRSLACALSLLLAGCEANTLTVDQYKTWLSDHRNALSAAAQQGALEFRIQFQPLELMALRELGDIEHPDVTRFNSTVEAYRGLEYYQFSIRGPSDVLQYGISDKREFYDRVEYYSFQMQDDLRLIVAEDTVRCKLFHFERNYGAAPFATFSLGFEAPKAKGNRRIQYHEPVFGLGWMELTVLQANIDNIPKIKL